MFKLIFFFATILAFAYAKPQYFAGYANPAVAYSAPVAYAAPSAYSAYSAYSPYAYSGYAYSPYSAVAYV